MAALNPNRYAGPAEAALLRDDIAADEAARPELQQRAARAQTAVHNAKESLRAAQEAYESAQRIQDSVTHLEQLLEERLRLSRGFLHPIRLLPDELLATIFLDARDLGWHEDRQIAFTVAALCKGWRRAALSAPRLWAYVNCALRDESNGTTTPRWIPYIQTHLARSASVPLSVYISYYATKPLPYAAELWTIVTKLFRRASSFVFITSLNVTRELSLCMDQPAPDLVELDIGDGESSECTTSVFRMGAAFLAPRLTTFAHCGSKLRWSENRIYSSVTKVELRTEEFKTQHLLNLVRRFPNIRELDLFASNTLVSPIRISIHAAHLQKLCLTLSAGFMDSTVAQSFKFPSLREARIQAEGTTVWDQGDLATFLRSALATVVTLILELDVASGVALGLSACTRLESLTIGAKTKCCIDEDADVVFDALSHTDADGTWLCPQLRALTIRGCVSRDSLADTLISIADARCSSAPSGPASRLQSIDLLGSHNGPSWTVYKTVLQERLDSIIHA
ncbi:hypothetical protein EXIGLDRAFT_731805 [Exidia glandulosa HHB12029]|uniref:Uncharacterized protein n=1 Tax=Exidia glandulosa HHB12029 TaxID=1314781 RepID=A0A165BR00_EXIGL|nr:hypothetical protein EXIGLDRAFT_731805 [Exidia glandulosa HHB12029]